MKKTLFSLLFILSAAFVFGQKTINDPTAEKRNVSGFHGIEVGTGIELVLTEGSEQVAVSAASAEFRDKIVTKVDDGILKIYYDNKLNSASNKKVHKDLKAYVSYKTLDKLHASTGAEVKVEGVIKSSSLDLNATTGARVDAEINVGTLVVEQNTGSKINLSGKADKLEIEGSTGSQFRAEDMSTTHCSIEVSTGAKAWVQAEKELQVKANTGGSVRYKGNASIREIRTNTGGSVSKI